MPVDGMILENPVSFLRSLLANTVHLSDRLNLQIEVRSGLHKYHHVATGMEIQASPISVVSSAKDLAF